MPKINAGHVFVQRIYYIVVYIVNRVGPNEEVIPF